MPTPEQVPGWFTQLLEDELSRWLSLSKDQVEKLYRHYELLMRWNQRMNLTSVKPGPETVIRHYCESLFFGAHLPATSGATVLDVGSGGGFPGVPIAVIKPDWIVVLVESSRRKATFLRESTRQLKNTSVVDCRMEDVTLHGDWVVSRAVDPEQVLNNVPRLAPNVGLMLSEDDFQSLRLKSSIAWMEPLRLPWGDRKICVYGRCST